MSSVNSGYGATSNLEAGSGFSLPSAHGNSVCLTAALIVADVVGAGILGLSVAVAKLGWLPGALLTVVLLAMNVHISMLMWRIRMHFPKMQSYVQMVEMAFSAAPEGQRRAMAIIAGGGQHLFIFSMLGIYILSGGRALGNMFYDMYVCLPTWMLITCGIIMPFHATARKLGTWESLVWLNVLTICGTCCIPLLFMMHQGTAVMRPPGSSFTAVAEFDFEDAFTALSTFTFAFTSQFMVIEIISEMKNPSHFPQAYICMAAPFQAIAFLVVGVGGYYYVGDHVSGMIGDNIPFGMVFRVAAVCLLTHMLVTYMVKGIILCRAMHSLVDKEAHDDDSQAAWNMWGVVVLIAAVAAWLMASIVPFFNNLVDLIGATLSPVCCYIIPIVSYLRWVKDTKPKEYPLKTLEGGILLLELILAVALLIFGSYYAVNEIVAKWETFGPPFACHCQQMWNTCQCSASHAGMLDACQAAALEVPARAIDMAVQVRDMVDMNFAWMLYFPAMNR